MIADSLVLIAELAALFFGVAFLVHISQRWMGEERMRRWMGGPPLVAALKGIGVGFVTPFCTYSAIPMLLGLRRAGVPPAGYVAFIVAAPVLDPVLFGALTLIVGLGAALVYLVVAFAAALTLALIAERVGASRLVDPLTAERADLARRRTRVTAVTTELESCHDWCSDDTARPWAGLGRETREASASALALLRSLGPVLMLGVGIGLAIELLVPPGLVASLAGQESGFAIPVAAALGTPLYFNTELFVPIADSLAAVGVGTGAIVALTISGAGANVPEFVILSRLARGRVVAVFIAHVLVVAMVGGLLADLIA